MLRSASHVLGTAEFFLSAVGTLLQGKEVDDLAEVKSLLLQVDQALGSSQCLFMFQWEGGSPSFYIIGRSSPQMYGFCQ